MRFFKNLFGRKTNPKARIFPNGWTETEISEDTYHTEIPLEQLNNWENEKWKKDKVDDLLNDNGFHIKQDFRAGTIYFVDKGKICEIYFELSGVSQFDILVFFDNLEEWFFPLKKEMMDFEKETIKTKLAIWLNTKKIKSDL